jgi:post-segregation antitoxin (ccd killing protein)
MADDGAIHVRKELSDALAAEAERAGISVDALAEEAIARHLDARKTLAHFAALRATADFDLLDRVLSRQGGEAPAEEDRVPTR